MRDRRSRGSRFERSPILAPSIHSPSFRSPALQIDDIIAQTRRRERTVRLGRVRGSAGAFVCARLRAGAAEPILVICPTSTRAEAFAADLRTFAPRADVRLLPRYDTKPYDRFSAHPEIEARRMSLLYALLAAQPETPLTVVAPWTALLRRVPPRSELRSRVTHLERGQTVDRDALLGVLVSAGYHRTHLVEERGEVAARGGILDLFPPQLPRPVRIEFDFERIGSIRPFEPDTQRSHDELPSVVAIPPRAYRLPHDVDGLLQEIRRRGRDRRIPESNLYAITEALARRHWPAAIENLEALLHERMETVLDYLPESALVVVDDPEAGHERVLRYETELREAHEHAAGEDRLVCAPDELYEPSGRAWEAVRARRPLLLDPLSVVDSTASELPLDLEASDHSELRRAIEDRRGSGRALEPLAERLRTWQALGRRVRITCPSLSAAERLADILLDYDHALGLHRAAGHGDSSPAAERATGGWSWPGPGQVDLAVASLSRGFELPAEGVVLVTEQDVFGTRIARRPVRAVRRGQSIDRLATLEPGDFLVHADHGIAQYGGLVQLSLGGVRQELLLLTYGKGDKLYLPVSRLDRIQRYAAAEDEPPRLDRLGGQTWTRTKARVQRAVRDMAEELLAVIAAREVLQGHAYRAPGPDYEEFEARFPFEDTPDQRRATEDVLADLQRERPMDRLVCGDVGFGKTEIACRAAYLVTAEGRQVALLVPTTLLCQQHTETLRTRFANTAVEIASLSRLTSAKQVREIREGLASGRIDIVVGTHKLLSSQIVFRDLGLVIVDEEHHFGVAHKERLKRLRKLVDVLTLTATPIPRTLQLAFSGMRDLSVISTPPPDRMAVRTQVCRFTDEIVREAVDRELHRGGQAFAVHNRVETIAEFAEHLQRILPGVRIAVAHGQMPAQALEKVMLGFLHRETDVLVSTAIIESGLDIPNANTILVHRADTFGLAQLHQLRGRVGRSDRRAYAYLFLPAHGELSDDARRRLEAIQDLSELGAGFRLATEDLEIRGAGNLLGAEQSGHIASVGYDLYMEMLEEAVRKLRGEAVEEAIEPEIRVPLAALLPEGYVEDVSQRLVLYKQLSSARDEAELGAIRDDLLDRYGPLPPEARNLLDVIRLKILCRRLALEGIDASPNELALRVGPRSRIDATRLCALIGRPGTPLRVTPDRRVRLAIRRAEDAIAEAFGLLDLLAAPEAPSTATRTAGDARG